MSSFKKIERLSSKKDITLLFETGKTKTFFPIKLIWRLNNFESSYPCRIVIVVPKRIFKRAVDRNLLKRRIREAYRTQKAKLYSELDVKKIKLDLMLVYTSKEKLEFNTISESIAKCISQLVSISSQ